MFSQAAVSQPFDDLVVVPEKQILGSLVGVGDLFRIPTYVLCSNLRWRVTQVLYFRYYFFEIITRMLFHNILMLIINSYYHFIITQILFL